MNTRCVRRSPAEGGGGDSIELARRRFDEHLAMIADLRESSSAEIARVGDRLAAVLRAGGKLLIFGNGGSAADAQHIAAEIVGRYKTERRGLPAVALTTDTSALTAIANDYGFEAVFSRQLEALANAGDMAVGISTSGNSPNVLRAILLARELGLVTVGMTGRTGGKLKELVDHLIAVPWDETPRIQEGHILSGHIVCEIAEAAITAEVGGSRA